MPTQHERRQEWPSFGGSTARNSEVWTPLKPSRASRQIRARSQASARVFTSIGGREAFLESGLESKVQLVLAMRPDVVEIEEQPAPVNFIDAAGKLRTHIFDFRITLAGGDRIAIDVKPYQRISVRFKADLDCLARQIDRSFAKGVLVVTERSLPRDTVSDALLLRSVLQDEDHEAYVALVEALKSFEGPITIRQLGACLGRETSGFRAVVRLIASGVLIRISAPPLRLDTLVRASSSNTTSRGLE